MVLDELQVLKTPPPPPPPPTLRPLICLICESGDYDAERKIRSHFVGEKHWHVRTSLREVAEKKDYATVFKEYDYFFFYWGKGGPEWCQRNYDELVDSRGDLRNVPDPAAVIMYLGQDENADKKDFEWPWPIGR